MSFEGLSEKGKNDYPKFTSEQLKVNACEICTSIHTVRKYKIIRRNKTEETIFMCDGCSRVKVPLGIHLICLEKEKKFSGEKVEETEEVVVDDERDMGDSLSL